MQQTVGYGLLPGAGLSVTGLVIVIGSAFGLTSVFNRRRVPTSTIQILVFAVAGAGLAAGTGVQWATIGELAVIWTAAPLVAAVLGYVLTRLLDLIPAVRISYDAPEAGRAAGGWLGGALLAVGALASFAMGGNDVANATGSLVGTGTFTPLIAGLIGGLGLAAGVLTWGRPLLHRVAFDIVTVDRPMATATQLVQAAVVLTVVAFGFFTSMNQALVGAMIGAGAACGRETVHTSTLLGILRGWLIGPAAGIALSYGITALVAASTGTHTVLAVG